jgi:hypothetical protein
MLVAFGKALVDNALVSAEAIAVAFGPKLSAHHHVRCATSAMNTMRQ